jgi:hypothetical protein
LIQSFPGSVAAPTNAGHFPFMVAACETSSASLSVVYELVRANPALVVPVQLREFNTFHYTTWMIQHCLLQ